MQTLAWRALYALSCDARSGADISGESNVAAEAALHGFIVSRSERCGAAGVVVLVEGAPRSGKSHVVSAALRRAAVDRVDTWDEEASCGRSTNRSKTYTPSMRSRGVHTYLDDDRGGSSSSNSRGSVMVVDNLHEIQAGDRTAVSLLARKSEAIKTPSSTVTLPPLLIVTYDPAAFEARVLAQVRALATAECPPLLLRHPSSEETEVFLRDRMGLSGFDGLDGSTFERGVEAAVKTIFRHRGDKEEGHENKEDEGERDEDAEYTGFKLDSLARVLREGAASRSLLRNARASSGISHALLLANSMIAERDADAGDDAWRSGAQRIAVAVREQAKKCARSIL